jgi:glycosyltransferase involved in cell wall biosynthesis
LTNVMHIITDLDVGGAEMTLQRLVKGHYGKSDYRHVVISLKGIGKIGRQLQDLGIEVRALNIRSLLEFPRAIRQLVKWIRVSRPDAVQTWMYHADLLGGLAARFAGNRPVIWSVRCTAIPQRGYSATRMVVTLCSWLSRFVPAVIVCCAESARLVHIKKGYDRTKMVVISNGYDLQAFHSDSALRMRARAAFGFAEDDVVVGTVGRFDPLKDYRTFVLSAAILAPNFERVKFLMVGREIDEGNQSLRAWIAESGLADKFVLAGERDDIPGCLAAMDLFCLSSVAEGFPNVVCEAMAMKVPCVVTDVGDAAKIVADTGIVVMARSQSALAAGLEDMLLKGSAARLRLGEMARRRIEENYSIETVAAKFETIYDQLTRKLPTESSEIAVTN